MINGEQCVMAPGTTLMLLWSASSWDMLTLEVRAFIDISVCLFIILFVLLCIDGTAYYNAHFGAGSGPIFLDDVKCTSKSSQLLECPSSPILSHSCLHSDDVGVGCEGIAIIECYCSYL